MRFQGAQNAIPMQKGCPSGMRGDQPVDCVAYNYYYCAWLKGARCITLLVNSSTCAAIALGIAVALLGIGSTRFIGCIYRTVPEHRVFAFQREMSGGVKDGK